MPDIKPFRAFLYDPRNVNIADVVAPPYDVITARRQSALYAASEYNVVRMVLNRDRDPYRSAARMLDRWLGDGILRQDGVPAMYVLSQAFRLPGGEEVVRSGFISACRLEDFGTGRIYPHEKTHSGPKEDRFRLFQATNMMFSQIFGLFNDRRRSLDPHLGQVMASAPLYELSFEGIRNKLWRLHDERSLSDIADFIGSQRVFIADGHHRYETALRYRDASRLNNPDHTGKEAYNFVPMFLTNMDDPGLTLFPTHRLLHGVPAFSPQRFMKKLGDHFALSRYSSAPSMLEALRHQERHSYGLFLSGEQAYFLITLNEPTELARLAGADRLLGELDVSVLHAVVFANILGFSEGDAELRQYVEYERDAEKAIAAVRRGRAQAAFMLNPPRLEQVRAIALAGMVMPQKTTYFYPKLLSGLVNYSFGR